MRRLTILILTWGIVLGITEAVLGRAIAPPPLTQRLALAETVVVARIVGMEDIDVQANIEPGGPKVGYRIAVASIFQTLRGEKDLKRIRVGFLPPAGSLAKNPRINLEQGREYLLLLRKHADGEFLVCETLGDVLNKTDNSNFDKEMVQVARCLALLADAKAGLQSKDAADRLLTATMLIQKYRAPRPGEPKQEAIAAEESKLILTVLLETQDWIKFEQLSRTTPQFLFQQLNLTPQDGWIPPQPVAGQDYLPAYITAARRWLMDNVGKYRIQRFVQ